MLTGQKVIFQEIRNYLAGRMLNATRDAVLMEEVMKCLFARKRMLLNGRPSLSDDDLHLARSYREYFRQIRGVFADKDEILLDPPSIRFVDSRLATIDLLSPDRDPVGDLYEAFIGASIRGAEGQFFTPQNAGRWLVDAVAPTAGEAIIDPACGAGGFLLWAAQRAGPGVRLHGVEKDAYLAWLARARTAILGVDTQIHCGNSLSFESDAHDLRSDELLESFDVVLTNPPFGKNITSVTAQTQLKFSLGRKWKREQSGKYEPTTELATKAPPQVLFIERVLSLLRNGGRAGMVVPESLLSSRTYAHVVQYLQDRANVSAVVGMPEALFKSSGKGGTHTKTCLIIIERGRRRKFTFMAEAKWCGHDSRGRSIPKDDLPQIIDDYKLFRSGKPMTLGYQVQSTSLSGNILSPRYHEPAAQRATLHLSETHELVSVGELIDDGVLEVSTGNEVGKLAYGTGSIPFVRTSDISGWEIKIDPKHCVSEQIYNQLKQSQDVRRDDILMVRDGTYLIGSCAIITEYDEKIVYQSHIYKIRCLKREILSPLLLLAILSSDPIQKQIKAKTFTQDIIDSLGSRLVEIVLPLPRSRSARSRIEELVGKVIADRVEARELARAAKLLVVDPNIM